MKDHVQFVGDSSILVGMCDLPQILPDTCRVGDSDRISEFPRYLKIWYLAISTNDDISDSITYNETANDPITFKFSSASGNVERLLYSRNVSDTTEFFSHAS